MKQGVLLVNLGSPKSPEIPDLKVYLKEFLMDPRVIDFSFLKRYLLVNFLIIPRRIENSSHAYKSIWTAKGSPLLIHSQNLFKKVQNELPSYSVKLAMRYENPSIKAALQEFEKEGVEQVTVLPLYPQYATSSTESVFDEIKKCAPKFKIKNILQFFNHPDYIEGICEKARKANYESYSYFVFSFHGVPERHIYKQDSNCKLSDCCKKMQNPLCYRAQCLETARLIAEKLELPNEKYRVTFQSRLGKEKWLTPYTDLVLNELKEKGIKKVLVFSPAFVADCLETLEEIGMRAKEDYSPLQLDLLEALNDSDLFVKCIKDLVLKFCH